MSYSVADRIRFAVATVLIIGASAALPARSLGDELCPGLVDRDAPIPELLVHERDLTFDDVITALGFLRRELPATIERSTSVEALKGDPGYYIGYPNALVTLEAYVLRQDALSARAELADVDRSDSQRAREAQRRYEQARSSFCRSLQSAVFVD